MLTDAVKQLIYRAQRGDRDAVGELYRTYADVIYRYIVQRVPDSEAEDLVADVFVIMVDKLPTYKITGAPFEAWLYRIAWAKVADFHRKSYRTQQVELPETIADDHIPPEAALLQEQERDELRESLAKLSDDEQTVLILRFVERHSHATVAAMLEKSETAVKSIQHRALVKLTRLLGSEKKARSYLRGRDE